MVPLVGPAAVGAGEEIGQGAKTGDPEQIAHGVGNAVGLVGTLGLGSEKGKAATEAVSRKVTGPLTEKLRRIPRKAVEHATATTPKVAKEEARAAAQRNVDAEAQHSVDVEEHKAATEEAAHETRGRELQYQYEKDVAATEAAEKNAENAAKHAEEVKTVEADNAAKQAEYDAAKARVDEVEKAAKEQETQRGSLARQIKQQGARMIERLRRIKSSLKDDAAHSKLVRDGKASPIGKIDRLYAQVRTATKGMTVSRETLGDAAAEAKNLLKGSEENIKQIKDILSKSPEDADSMVANGERIPRGHPLFEQLYNPELDATSADVPPADFDTLQGYYSELGKALSSSTRLLPDVYRAVSSLRDNIGTMMKNMARDGGAGATLTEAQGLFRRYMEAFDDSKSPIAQALGERSPELAVGHLLKKGMRQPIRNDLAEFDPSRNGEGGAAALYDNMTQAYRNMKSVSKPIKVPETPKAPKLKATPEAPERVEPKATRPPNRVEAPDRPEEPEPEKIGNVDTQEAKRESLAKRRKFIVEKINWAATRVGGLGAIYELMRGRPGTAGQVAAVGLGMYGIGQTIDLLLQNEKVVNALIKVTPRDIAEIPPEMRGNLRAVVEEAQRRGIRVPPILVAAVGAPDKTRTRTVTLQELREQLSPAGQ